MSDFELREYRRDDVPALSALWTECFGDGPGFTEKFFAALPGMGSGVAAVRGGEILGAAYTLNAQELVCGEGARRVGYIYGVGVSARARSQGVGGALVHAVRALSLNLGAQVISTLPAEASLYAWYEKLLGVTPRLYRARRQIACRAASPVTPLSAAEYAHRREELLHGRPHLRLSACSMEFEGQLLAEYGGGFFAAEGGIGAAYLDDGTALVRELLCASPAAEDAAAAASGAYLGAETAELFLPAEKGEAYIAADGDIPAGCVWGLSFD